jgi:2-pyrone-4,6-dicarboxylate lactonase
VISRSISARAKLSGAHRVSQAAPDYLEAKPLHQALVTADPDQCVGGSGWPHARMESPMPNAGHLLDLFNAWTPDDAIRRRILVDNPAKLYDFAS